MDISQKEKDKYSYVIIYIWNLKNKTSEYNKKVTDSQIYRYINQLLAVGRGKGEGQDRGRGLRDTDFYV